MVTILLACFGFKYDIFRKEIIPLEALNRKNNSTRKYKWWQLDSLRRRNCIFADRLCLPLAKNVQCAKTSRLLGYVRRNTRLVKSTTVRRSAYLTLVRSHLGYATQVWTPQSKDLIRKLERVQRRATKYILDLPFICDQTYRDRITKLNLLPISYWHEFLDMIFFFKVVTGIVKVSPSVLPQVLVTRTTRSNSNRNVTHFISKKCNTVTFQRSFFNRTIRIWNTLANDLQLSCNLQISQFKSIMYKYYVDALDHNYDPEDPRSWKAICPSCNVSRNVSVHLRCCF